MRSIRIIVPYFGSWPEWYPLYLKSCSTNPTIDWLFFTDCVTPTDAPSNVCFTRISFQDYCSLVSKKLKINFKPEAFYKLCDIKPALGAIHENDIAGYDNFGFGDIDLFYGNLRKFFPDNLLDKLLVSTHKGMVSNHLCIMKNTLVARNAFRMIPTWRSCFENPKHVAFDDRHFTRLFLGIHPHDGLPSRIYRQLNPLYRKSFFKESFTTPFTWYDWVDGTKRHPKVWYWIRGEVFNNINGGQTFPYIHFMNYKNNRYRCCELHGSATWNGLRPLVRVGEEQAKDGWAISNEGIVPLTPKAMNGKRAEARASS